MNFKYYDLLSCVIIGFFAIVALLYATGNEYDKDLTMAYLAGSYVVGYLINSLSSLMEPFWYFTICGMPSDKLLTIDPKKKYTGIRRVRFYHAQEAINKLREQLNDNEADTKQMFSLAMRETNGNPTTRVQDFNAQYAFSRVLLTTLLVITIVAIVYEPCCWKSYLTIIPLLISWNRFRERGYYYAREVLNEYLNKNK